MTHVANEPNWDERVRQSLSAYRLTLPDDLRVLLDRYHLEDVAAKVVGIGSVGTRCYVALFMSVDHNPLILQVKEAMRSVLEPYTGRSPYDNQGQRVVIGQRLMQSASDIFLGWARGPHVRDFYVRQLRDMKMSASQRHLAPDLLNLPGWCRQIHLRGCVPSQLPASLSPPAARAAASPISRTWTEQEPALTTEGNAADFPPSAGSPTLRGRLIC